MALKILFADDSMTAQNMGKKILSDAGYDVIAVSNGAAALKKINELKPAIVVLDVYMPGYTGLEVCEKMRAAHETSKTPVLLTVGKMEAYKPEDGTRVKANGLIVKPFEATDLLTAVEKLAGSLSTKSGAVGSSKLEDYETTVLMQQPPFEQDGSEGRHQGELLKSKAAAVSVPSEMATHAAYGFDELLAPPADEPPTSATNKASSTTSSAPETEVTSTETEFTVSRVEIASPEFSAENHHAAKEASRPGSAVSASVPGTPKKDVLLERFDAILKGEPLPKKAAGFEPTAVEPTPEVSIASEIEFEPTSLGPASSVSVTREPGLDPFSSDAVASGFSGYQSWEASEAAPAVEPLQQAELASAASPVEGTASLDPYIEPESATAEVADSDIVEVIPEETSEAARDSETDDFEARVAAAMSAYESEAPAQEHEVAPAIVEREAEDAEFLLARHAVAQETAHEIEVVSQFDGPQTDKAQVTQKQRPELVQQMYQDISEVPSEGHTPEKVVPPLAATKAAAEKIPGSEVELARALAAAAGAESAPSTAEPSSANLATQSTSAPGERTMISRVVSRVLERSLPDILSQVMKEIENERKK